MIQFEFGGGHGKIFTVNASLFREVSRINHLLNLKFFHFLYET